MIDNELVVRVSLDGRITKIDFKTVRNASDFDDLNYMYWNEDDINSAVQFLDRLIRESWAATDPDGFVNRLMEMFASYVPDSDDLLSYYSDASKMLNLYNEYLTEREAGTENESLMQIIEEMKLIVQAA